MTAVIISNIVGVTMAWKGFSYWALATQTLVYILLNSLLLWYYSSWRPTFHVDFTPLKEMFKFSCKILATTILTHINNSVLNILLGRLYTPKEVGDYSQANIWSSKCYYLLQGMVDQVAQPIFTVVTEERERQLHILRKLVRFIAFLSFPMLFGLSLVSHEFILVTIQEKWLVSADYLQILCIGGAFIPIYTVFSNLIISKGKSGTYLLITLALCVCQILAMILLYPFGILTMIVVYTLISVLWVFINHFFVKKYTGYRLSHFLLDILPFALTALGVMCITYACTMMIINPYVLLLVRVALAASLYYILMRAANVVVLKECMDFIFRRKTL